MHCTGVPDVLSNYLRSGSARLEVMTTNCQCCLKPSRMHCDLTLRIMIVGIAVFKNIPPGMLYDTVELDGGKDGGRQNLACEGNKPIAGSPVREETD